MNTLSLVIIGILTILTMVFFVIFFILIHQKRMFENRALIIEKENTHQKRLVNATIEVAELERKKIAANMHDDVGTALNVINLHLSRMARHTKEPELVEQLLKESKDLLNTSIETIRGIAKDLMPPVLIRLGYENGISELCRQLNETKAYEVVFSPSGEKLSLSKNAELQLYRIVQEVINNLIKHAKPTHISISVQLTPESYVTKIKHNGVGINSSMINNLTLEKKGVGLRSIESRAQMINATVQYIIKNSTESIINIDVPKDEITN